MVCAKPAPRPWRKTRGLASGVPMVSNVSCMMAGLWFGSGKFESRILLMGEICEGVSNVGLCFEREGPIVVSVS